MLFANSLLLGIGALLVGVPIVLHFTMRPKPKPLPFPAIHLLKEIHLSTSRSLQLKHFLLLLARCLLLFLPAMALAGPSVLEDSLAGWYAAGITGILALGMVVVAIATWLRKRNRFLAALSGVMSLGAITWFLMNLVAALGSETRQLIGNAEEPVAAAIIVDTSPRMDYRRDNKTHLESAKENAIWILRQLPPESQVSVIDPADNEPFFSVDAGAAERRIDSLSISFVDGSLVDAIRQAQKLLEESDLERHEIYVITDLSIRSWRGASLDKEFSNVTETGTDNAQSRIFIFDVGTNQPANVRLNNLRPEAVRLSANSSLSIESSVSSAGLSGDRVIEMKIEKPDVARPMIVDGKVLTPEEFWTIQQAINVTSGESTGFQLRFEESLPEGVHHGSVTVLGSDGLKLDDERFFTVEVSQLWSGLVVSGPGVSPLNVTESLAPPGYEDYALTVCQQSEMGTIDLGQFNAVFLLDPGPLTEAEWERLAKFTREGGGIGFFIGANAIAQGVLDPSFATETARNLMGGELTLVRDRREAVDMVYLAPGDTAHPVFASIRPYQTMLAWNVFPVRMYWGFNPEFSVETPGQIVLVYSDGQPAVVDHVIGKGRSIVMTSPVTEPSRPEGRTSWNDLFAGEALPAFLLVRGIGEYLVQARSETLNLLTGQPALLKNDIRIHPESYTVFSPVPDRPPTEVKASRGELRFVQTESPGHYRFKGVRNGVVTRGFSVNLDDKSTDLTRATTEQLDQLLGADQYRLANERNEFERQQGKSRRGQEFYPLVFVVMCVILGVENLLSNLFYGQSRRNQKVPG